MLTRESVSESDRRYFWWSCFCCSAVHTLYLNLPCPLCYYYYYYYHWTCSGRCIPAAFSSTSEHVASVLIPL